MLQSMPVVSDRARADLVGPTELAHDRPWSTVLRVPLVDGIALAIRAGVFAHTFARLRQRDALPPAALPAFDGGFGIVLRRAVRETIDA
jgi:hypothetical protein